MSLETRSEPVRLRDKIDAALQNVRPEQSPKTAFIEVWQVVQSDYETMRHIVHQYISRLLDEKRVRATVASRTKTVESISKSINRRDDAEAKEQKQKFRSPQDIFDGLHDLVGLRVVVDYPSGLDKSFHLIEESFQIKMFNSFSSDRAVGQQWKSKFGAYETRNYLLRPGSSIDLATYAGVLFEIQVTTMAESLYNKLAHSLLYKASQGGLSRKDEMIIDMGHGAALLYWITVACVEERLEGNFDETVQTSKFPQSVRHLAGHEGTVTNLDAVVNATPDFPSTSKDSTSIDFLLKSLADIRLTDTPDEDIWDRIRVKIGLDQHQILGSLPTVPEARCDSKDFEDSPKCHRKTRKEVRNVITGWLDDSQAETLFWLHAPAGVGKTTLARTLVDDLRALQLAAGYFFRRGHELRNDTSRVFPTIASQLTRTIPSFANALRLSIGTFNIESMDKLALREQFNTLIYNPLRSIKHMPKNMLIIIDALDECTKPNDIQLMLELFAQLKDLEGFRVRVFFSSRNTRSVNNAFLKVTYREMALHEQFLDATRLEMRTVLEDGLGEIKRLRNVKQESWPSAEDFNTILHYATSPSPLFIYTSTLLRHIDGRDPKKRLQRWLERSRNSVSQLDHIYDPIMKSILAGDGDDDIQEPLDQAEIQSLQLIVGSLLLLARPLSANDLRNLLEMDEGRFQTTLRSLHAVLHAPDDKCPINLIHKSFADYILGIGDDVTGTARIDPLQIHEHLARQCINHMRGGLQKNICNVDSPLTLAREFDQDRVTKFIPPELAYACNHWIHHLQRGPEALDLVGPFLKQHLLHWLEVLSILGEQLLGEGGIAIRNLVSLTQQHPGECLPGSDIVQEAQVLLNAHGQVIKEYPLQVYGICLVRQRLESRVSQLFAKSSATRLANIGNIRGAGLALPSGTKEIHMDSTDAMTISQDCQTIAGYGETGIRVADTELGLVLTTLPGGVTLNRDRRFQKNYTSPILAISFSSDQRFIIGLTNTAKVFVWNTQTREEPIYRGSLNAIDERFESGDIDGQFSVAVATQGTVVYVWTFDHGFDCVVKTMGNTRKGGLTWYPYNSVRDHIIDVSLSAKGPTDWTVALIDGFGVVFIWSASQKRRPGPYRIGFPQLGPEPHHHRVATSPCRSLIASGFLGEIQLRRCYEDEWSLAHRIPWPSSMKSLRFFPNEKALAVVEQGMSSVIPVPGQFTTRRENIRKIQIRNVLREVQIVSQSLFDASAIFRSRQIMPCWQRLLTSFRSYPQFVQIPEPSKITSMKLASNKRNLVTNSVTHAVLVWDIETGYLQHEIRKGRNATAISSDGEMLAVSETLRSVRIWNLETTPAQEVSRVPFHFSQCMEFTLDSRSLAVCHDRGVSRWNVITGKREWFHEDLSLGRTKLKISPDGLTIVAFSTSGAYSIDAMTGCCRMKLDWPSLDSNGISLRHEDVVIGNICFLDTSKVVLLYLSKVDGVLAWDLESNNVSVADSAIRSEARCITCVSMDFRVRRVNYRGHGVFPIGGQEVYAAAGNRMVLAGNDGEFTAIDFDDDRIGEI